MPIQTRCPSCSAAVPTGAAWCSLCHSDLRPRPKPVAAAPLPSSTIVLAPVQGGSETPAPTPTYDLDAALDGELVDGYAGYADDEDDDEPAPRGRHSREPAPAERPSRALPPRTGSRSTGRRAAGRTPARSGSRSTTAVADLGDLALPAPGEATPEQVDELAEAMLTRLAVTEPQPRLLDPDDFPGGRWGLAGAGLAAVLVVLLVLYTILGLILR